MKKADKPLTEYHKLYYQRKLMITLLEKFKEEDCHEIIEIMDKSLYPKFYKITKLSELDKLHKEVFDKINEYLANKKN